MSLIIQKIPFLIELFFNGTFILLYSLKIANRLPEALSMELVDNVLGMMSGFVPIVMFMVVMVNYMGSRNFEDFVRRYLFSLLVFIPLLISWGDIQFAFWLSSAHLLSSVLSLYDADEEESVVDEIIKGHNKGILESMGLKPAQVVLLSFMLIICVGTFLLMLPVATVEGHELSLADALFMATSATCVTGLATVPIDSHFTIFGQVVILLLIQIGGLGYMTLYTSIIVLLGRSIGMKDRIIMQDLLNVSSLEGLMDVIVDIVKYTFFIELWGGIVLTIAFTFEGFEFGNAIYFGFFHSISAFCNAGFSLFPSSLESYATNPLIHGTVAVLISLGGVGFIVLKEMKAVIAEGRSFARITLHTRIVLVMSIIMTVGGAIFIFFGEFLNALDGFNLWEKTQIALFQSITLRTAGFNTIPMGNLHAHTLYFMSLLMFVGASPGSTGGGVKTTTVAILFQSIKSTLKGRNWVGIFDRQIPGPMVVRATALTFISILITSFFILVMMKIEPEAHFLSLFFEVISASGTVGLTLGITPFLSVFGKLAISLVMLIGRIGPLTLMLAIGTDEEKSEGFAYPDGRVMIG